MSGARHVKTLVNHIVMLVMVACMVWCLAGLVSPERAQSASGSTPVVVYTVQPGDTLWGYAAGITPEGGNVGDTVDELVRLNNLDTSSLHAGQRLIVPEAA